MSYLMHYGKGHLDGGHSGRYPYGSGERPYQSWGSKKLNRRGTSGDDYFLKKDKTLYRTTTNPEEKPNNNMVNRNYFSITGADANRWDKHLGEAYLARNTLTFNNTYKTKRDLKIMGAKQQGKLYAGMVLKNKGFEKELYKDIETRVSTKQRAHEFWNELGSPQQRVGWNISRYTASGQKFIEAVMNKSYDGITDEFGTDVSNTPVIIFYPEDKVEKTKTEFSDTVKKRYSSQTLKTMSKQLKKKYGVKLS